MQFNLEKLELNSLLQNKRPKDFNNLLKILRREKPDRPTLFEFFIDFTICGRLNDGVEIDTNNLDSMIPAMIKAYSNAGYDYLTLHGSDFRFKDGRVQGNHASVSMNDGFLIYDRESFDKYDWPNPDAFDYSRLTKYESDLIEGMKFIVYGNNGVLETVIALVGYENLCYMIFDEPDLVKDIFDAVGSRFVRYYEICATYDSVGALISNDDWGFNTQTMLSVDDMRKYVIPWHKKIVEVIHASGKPAIMHSCGRLLDVMDDIIDVIKYDAKHSNEDSILPVEDGYAKYADRIAILGGIDLDFLCRAKPEEIFTRSKNMLELSAQKGGYALGSGNSIPDYVPFENYLAMLTAVHKL